MVKNSLYSQLDLRGMHCSIASRFFLKIKYLITSSITGSFREFKDKITIEGTDFSNAKVTVTIYVKSIYYYQS